MADAELHIAGLEDFIELLENGQKKMIETVSQALYQFAEEVMAESKLVVPVDTGALMNSGKVMPPTFSDNTVEVTLGYGDESVGYAIYVHEELQSRSGAPINWTRPGSGPKYLENPLKAKMDKLPEIITAAIKEAFKV